MLAKPLCTGDSPLVGEVILWLRVTHFPEQRLIFVHIASRILQELDIRGQDYDLFQIAVSLKEINRFNLNGVVFSIFSITL